ncbi:hypothetical protein NQ314_013273 [Rhamnusium bicolor]|uniref:C2H2-type domain-containing protein n=1 Tax=Rhamnusium bicolor TaxID=1586634 RepID=A0AAV8X9C2_9CUCU|nr:hypothetical protein NQ314_013273 [Rhamnusium bicolor]
MYIGCDLCNKPFKRKDKLKSHVQRVHPVNDVCSHDHISKNINRSCKILENEYERGNHDVLSVAPEKMQSFAQPTSRSSTHNNNNFC